MAKNTKKAASKPAKKVAKPAPKKPSKPAPKKPEPKKAAKPAPKKPEPKKIVKPAPKKPEPKKPEPKKVVKPEPKKPEPKKPEPKKPEPKKPEPKKPEPKKPEPKVVEKAEAKKPVKPEPKKPEAAPVTPKAPPAPVVKPIVVELPPEKETKETPESPVGPIRERPDDEELFTVDELEGFRTQLMAEKRKLLDKARQALETGGVKLDKEEMYDELDLASATVDQALVFKLLDRDRKLLNEIEHALAKIDSGDYGYCEGTGEPIPKRRLELRPWTKHSVKYKEYLERMKKSGRGVVDEEESFDGGGMNS